MKDEFKEALAETLEVDASEIESDYELEESEMWDSMTIVTVIALIDEHYGKSVEGEKLAACETVADIEKLIASS